MLWDFYALAIVVLLFHVRYAHTSYSLIIFIIFISSFHSVRPLQGFGIE